MSGVAAAIPITLLGACLLGWALRAGRGWFERHVFTSYCASSAGDLWLARGLRATGVIAGLLILWKARALWRRRERETIANRLAAGARIGVAVLLAVLVAEVVLRQVAIGEKAPLGRSDLPLARAHSRYGWVLVPSQTRSVTVADRRVEYAVDAGGNRVARPGEDFDPTRETLIITGESIGFGYGLPWDETFFARLGARFGLQLVNLSVPGYGSDQAYLRLIDALGRLEHPLAAVMVFVPKQIRRAGLPWRPRLALGDGGALELLAPEGGLGLRLARLWRDEPYHGDGALAVTRVVLRESARVLAARGAAVLFVVTNYGPRCLEDEGGAPWLVRELFDRERLPYVRVDIAPDEHLPLPGDFHPDARASGRIAQTVTGALEQQLKARRYPGRL